MTSLTLLRLSAPRTPRLKLTRPRIEKGECQPQGAHEREVALELCTLLDVVHTVVKKRCPFISGPRVVVRRRRILRE